jgi:hypothetical protein
MDSPSTTLVLRSTEEEKNLTYVVEIEEGKAQHVCYTSENYLQSLIAAREIFGRLRSTGTDVGVLIEAQHNRGASYAVNDFNFESDFQDTDSFYKDLSNEFETEKSKEDLSNEIFRKLVNREKLNEYQERRFLAQIKANNKD